MYKSTDSSYLEQQIFSTFSKLPAIKLAFGLLIIYLVFASWYTVDQGERGVHLRNGAIIGTSEPGFGFKIPFFDSISKISIQTTSRTYETISAYSKDQQPAIIRASVTFNVPPAEVETVYENFRNIGNMESRILDRHVPTQVENTFGRYTAISAVQNRTQFVKDLTDAIKESVSGPIHIESVQVENIDFSDAYEKSVEDRMRAEVEVQTQKQNLEKERISAQIAVTQAQAQADSQLAKAKSEAESIRIKGEAEATAIKARAEALAKNQDLIELTKAEKWNGSLPTTMIPNATLPFFQTNK